MPSKKWVTLEKKLVPDCQNRINGKQPRIKW